MLNAMNNQLHALPTYNSPTPKKPNLFQAAYKSAYARLLGICLALPCFTSCKGITVQSAIVHDGIQDVLEQKKDSKPTMKDLEALESIIDIEFTVIVTAEDGTETKHSVCVSDGGLTITVDGKPHTLTAVSAQGNTHEVASYSDCVSEPNVVSSDGYVHVSNLGRMRISSEDFAVIVSALAKSTESSTTVECIRYQLEPSLALNALTLGQLQREQTISVTYESSE